MSKKSKTKSKSGNKRTKIAAAVFECRDRNGDVTPKAVVEAARDPNNILHNEFEWDRDMLVEQALEARAAELIRQSRSVITLEDKVIIFPTFISKPRSVDRKFTQTVAVARNAALKTLALEAEVARIKSAVLRAKSLAMVFGLSAEFEMMLQQIVDIEAALSAAA